MNSIPNIKDATYKKIYDELVKRFLLDRKTIESSSFFKYLNEKFGNDFNLNKNVFIAKIQSMSLKSDPYKLRIRQDKFLKLAKSGEFGILLSSYKNSILCFFTKSFTNYKFPDNNGNSFITFSYEELDKKIAIDNSDNVAIKTIKGNNNPKYIFYSANIQKFNKEYFDKFYNELENYNLSHYKDEIIEMFIPQIPNSSKEEIKNYFPSLCALATLSKCPCGKEIDVDFLERYDLSYRHFHHLLPKKFLIQKMTNEEGVLDWGKIHNYLNLIPLCLPCHQLIHKGSKYPELVDDIFNSIISLYKEKEIYDDFSKYLIDTNTTINELLDFYKNKH